MFVVVLFVLMFASVNGICESDDINSPIRLQEFGDVVYNNRLDNAKIYVENGIDINYMNKFGETPLALAYRAGHKDMIKYLIENGADTDVVNIKNFGRPIFHHYVIQSDDDMVRFLIEHGADINKTDYLQHTAVLYAVDNQDYEMVEYLVENGADLNIVNKFNEKTTVDIAIGKKDLKLVKYLLDNGGQIDLTNNDSIETAFWNRDKDMLKLLTKHGIFAEGEDIIVLIRNDEDLENWDFLVKAGSITNNDNTFRNAWEPPVLIEVVNDDNLYLVKYLLKNMNTYHLDVNSTDRDGKTPLMFAAKNGNLEIVKTLVQNGADLNSQDHEYYTALMLAVMNNHLDIVKYLVEQNADITCKDYKGVNALLLSKFKGLNHITEYLMQIY